MSPCFPNWIELAGVKQGDAVVAQGPGHVGLMCIVAAKLAGASTIIATGMATDAMRLEVARSVGAQHTIDARNENVVARVKEITRGRGASVVIDCMAISREALAQALDAVRFGGTVVLAGLKDMAPVGIVTDKIVFGGLTIKGGSGSTAASMRAAVNYLNGGRVLTETLLGEVLPPKISTRQWRCSNASIRPATPLGLPSGTGESTATGSWRACWPRSRAGTTRMAALYAPYSARLAGRANCQCPAAGPRASLSLLRATCTTPTRPSGKAGGEMGLGAKGPSDED